MSNFFGTVSHANTAIEAPVYEGHIEPTSDALMSIAVEGVIEGLQVQAALHVADATIAYTAVNESAGAAEVVLEGVLGNTVGKLKDGLRKLWAKIKAWFKSVTKTFSLMFAKGKDFVKKYKKEILEKPAAGFKYDGHIWTIDAGNTKATALLKAIDGTLGAVLNDAAKVTTGDFTSDIDAAKKADASGIAKEFDQAEIKEKLIEKLGATLGSGVNEMSEIKEKLQEAYRGNKDETEEIKDFGKMSRGALIDLIEKTDKNSKVVTDVEKEVDKQFNESLKALSKFEAALGKSKDSDFHGGENGGAKSRARITTLASNVSSITRYAQSLNTAIAGAAVDNIKAAAAEAESVLKRFIKFKGVKESFGDESAPVGSENVLENFMATIKL